MQNQCDYKTRFWPNPKHQCPKTDPMTWINLDRLVFLLCLVCNELVEMWAISLRLHRLLLSILKHGSYSVVKLWRSSKTWFVIGFLHFVGKLTRHSSKNQICSFCASCNLHLSKFRSKIWRLRLPRYLISTTNIFALLGVLTAALPLKFFFFSTRSNWSHVCIGLILCFFLLDYLQKSSVRCKTTNAMCTYIINIDVCSSSTASIAHGEGA